MNRRSFLKKIGVASLSVFPLACASPARMKARRERPNILFIFSDDHAFQAISAYGSKINRTPNIDRIGAKGAILDNCYCCNSICAPSRATVLTGKHSHANGLRTNGDRFDGGQQTVAKLMQEVGYQTAMIGKWHLKTDPTGFDYWEILPGQGSYYNPDFRSSGGKKRYPGYVSDITVDLALDWLEEKRDKDKPFMLMCQQKAPHRNWMPGPRHLNMYDDVTIPEPSNLFDDYANRNSGLKQNEMSIAEYFMFDRDLKVTGSKIKDALGRDYSNYELKRMNPEQKQRWMEAYGPKNEVFEKSDLKGKELVRWKYQRYIKDYLRCVASVDDNVGRLLDYLDSNGLAENTLVIYSSDQGFYLGEHGWYDKRWMYEESFRMPFLAKWPGVIKPGTRSSKLAQNIDFAPTFLAATNQSVPDDMQGVSLLPLLEGKKPAGWRKSIYYHYYEKGEHNVPRHYGVRTERYKLIHYYDLGEWELFDMDNDPREMKSLYDDPAYKSVRKELLAELRKLEKQYQVPS